MYNPQEYESVRAVANHDHHHDRMQNLLHAIHLLNVQPPQAPPLPAVPYQQIPKFSWQRSYIFMVLHIVYQLVGDVLIKTCWKKQNECRIDTIWIELCGFGIDKRVLFTCVLCFVLHIRAEHFCNLWFSWCHDINWVCCNNVRKKFN